MDVVKLICACGKPLSVIFRGGQWSLGHFEELCGPIITHKSFEKVVQKYRFLASNDFYEWKQFMSTVSHGGGVEVQV